MTSISQSSLLELRYDTIPWKPNVLFSRRSKKQKEKSEIGIHWIGRWNVPSWCCVWDTISHERLVQWIEINAKRMTVIGDMDSLQRFITIYHFGSSHIAMKSPLEALRPLAMSRSSFNSILLASIQSISKHYLTSIYDSKWIRMAFSYQRHNVVTIDFSYWRGLKCLMFRFWGYLISILFFHFRIPFD